MSHYFSYSDKDKDKDKDRSKRTSSSKSKVKFSKDSRSKSRSRSRDHDKKDKDKEKAEESKDDEPFNPANLDKVHVQAACYVRVVIVILLASLKVCLNAFSSGSRTETA